MLLPVFPKGKKTERAAKKDPCFGQWKNDLTRCCQVDTNIIGEAVSVRQTLASPNFIQYVLANVVVIEGDDPSCDGSDWQREHKARETKEGGVTKSIENFHAPMMATGG